MATESSRLILNGEEGVASEIARLLRWAEEAYFCVSYARHKAFRLLEADLKDFLQGRSGKLRAIFDIERFFTDPDVIAEFATIPGDSQCKLYFRVTSTAGTNGFEAVTFHAKLYAFRKQNEARIIVGSSNFTLGGLKTNIEANLLVTVSAHSPLYLSFLKFFDQIWDSPQALFPDEREILERYSELNSEMRRINKRAQARLNKVQKEIGIVVQEAQREFEGQLDRETAYFLGLICGGGRVEDIGNRVIKIRYHKGPYHPRSRSKGIISAPGISEVNIPQPFALHRDVLNVKEQLERVFRRRKTNEKVTFKSNSNYDYNLILRFEEGSPYWAIVRQLLRKCRIKNKRIVPRVPNEILTTKSKHIRMAFIKGYVDIRSRISETDREGTKGPLRVAISISRDADKFARELSALIKKHIGVKKVPILYGKPRGRETMIRLDPCDLPNNFFSIYWKRILLKDFASFNSSKFPKTGSRVRSAGDKRIK